MLSASAPTTTVRAKYAMALAFGALICSCAAAAAEPVNPPAGKAPMTSAQVIQVLDQTVDWYRTLGFQQVAANEPSDLLILYDNRQTATQVVRLAFEIARANAQMLGGEPSAASGAAGAAASADSLAQLQKTLDARKQTIDAQLQSARLSLAHARQKNRSDLQARVSGLQGELDLIDARKNLLNTMSEFINSSGSEGSGANALKAQIDAMALALPSAGIGAAASNTMAPAGASAPASASAPAPAATSSAPLAQPSAAGGSLSAQFGIWALASNAFRLSEKIHAIDGMDRGTAALQDTYAQIRTPLINQLKTLLARGDALAAQADAANGAAAIGATDVRGQLDALVSQFKATSALLIPLSKEGVLLGQFRRNLGGWRDAVKSQYRDALKKLAIRVGFLLAVLAVVFVAAELWRRAVLRYVQDTRRRHQFLLLRRIALWALVVVIVGFAFASELGSIVTFAGLITAGVAVAMQSVLVSIVGYFFLIGKYGIRVGDRVQIGDVTGEVIDLGLVRMYLMELGGHGFSGPTGRVVAYANSIVFQVSTGLYKKFPGVSIAWHEITLNLPAGCDYAAAKEKLLAAATGALQDYREEIVRQTNEIQRTTASKSGGDAQPTVRLNFSATAVQAIVRYPVHLQHAAEIDERVSRELLNAIPSTAE